MAFRFNPFSGTLDEVSIPVQDNTVAPTMAGNGDIQTATVTSQGRLYFEANGVRYFIVGTTPLAGGVNIFQGQPIPIGMGLTITYANGVT